MKGRTERTDINEWLAKLMQASSKKSEYGRLWKSVYRNVNVAKRRRVAVNIGKINEYSKNDDNIIVPGKVLSNGKIDHSVNIAAVSFTKKAAEALKESNSKMLTLDEMFTRKRIKVIR